MPAPRVIIRQRKRQWIIRLRVALHQLAEIKSPREHIGAGIETLFMGKIRDVFRARPFHRRRLLDLHQANFPRPPAPVRVKSRFPPDHRLNQQRVHIVTFRRGVDLRLKFPRLADDNPQIRAAPDNAKRDQRQNYPQPFHEQIVAAARADCIPNFFNAPSNCRALDTPSIPLNPAY